VILLLARCGPQGGYSSMIAALEWGELSAARPGRTLPPRERFSTHFTGGWVGPRAGLDWRKISFPPGFFVKLRLYCYLHVTELAG
jgi:hypothetical protein